MLPRPSEMQEVMTPWSVTTDNNLHCVQKFEGLGIRYVSGEGENSIGNTQASFRNISTWILFPEKS